MTTNEDTHDWTVTEVDRLPKCDFCSNEAHYDGKTIHGPWAFMCRRHFKTAGYGKVGFSIGQKLVVK